MAARRSHIDTDGGGSPAQSAREITIVANDIGAVGGMERVLGELIEGLVARGDRVTVIARTCRLACGGYEFHRVRGPQRPFVIAHPWFILAGSLKLARRRRGLVHATGAIVLNRVDVISVHYCHQVGPAQPSRATPLFRLQVKLASLLKRWGERAYYPRSGARAFVCVSEGVAEEMRSHYPELAERVMTIHNGVDTESFAPGVRAAEAQGMRARLELPATSLAAAFVGSEWERKGLEPLIRALALAPEWTALVAGGGDRDRYQRLADELGVGGRVRWLGITSDVQLVYQAADAFVLPTTYETFSLVTFEAAASGLPVLATPVSGVRELIEDGRNGYLVTREPALIGERLRRLGADAALRERMGIAARESALPFSWERMVNAHRALYARLAAQPVATTARV